MDYTKQTLWNKLVWHVLPQRCVLCGKWKLWGKMPHNKCEDYELGRTETDEYAKYCVSPASPRNK